MKWTLPQGQRQHIGAAALNTGSIQGSVKLQPNAKPKPKSVFRALNVPKLRRVGVVAGCIYLVAVHLLLALMLWKSNAIDLFERKLVNQPYYEEFDAAFSNSYHWMKRLDQKAQTGSFLLLGDSQILGLDLNGIVTNPVNFGVSGETTGRLMRRLDGLAAPSNARGILLSIGINEFLYRGVEESVDEYRQMLSMLPEKIPLLVVAIFPIDETVQTRTTNAEIARFNKAIESMCNERAGCQMVDASASLAGADGQLIEDYHNGDGLHLNPAGYAIWREVLRPMLSDF